MLNIETKLSADLFLDLEKFELTVKNDILISGAAGMAKVIYDEVKLNTSGARATGKPLDPPGVKTGTLHNAVYRVYSKERSTAETRMYRISVNKSKARHWWLVEFGSSRAPAHPYIRPAFDHIPQAIEAGQERMRQRMLAL